MIKDTNRYPYLLLLPIFLILGAIVFYPIGYAIFLSLHNYVLTRPLEIAFSGLSNYIKIFTKDALFLRSLLRTGKWVFWTISLELLLGLIAAWLLNREFRGRNIIRAVILLPWVFPSVLTGLVWVWMLNDSYGVINDILLKLHLIDNFIPWLSQSSTALYSVIIAQVWHGTPFFIIMILAAMQSIPVELYKAAKIDGANRWQEFWYITWPAILPTTMIVTLLRTIWTASYVEHIQIMTGGGPGESTLTLPLYIFRKAYSYLDFGYGASLSMVLIIMLSGLVWVYLRLIKSNK